MNTMNRKNRKDILLVHASPFVLCWMKSALEKQGYNVRTARSCDFAVRELHKKLPDLISLDLDMPCHMGVRFSHALKRNKSWAAIPRLTMRKTEGYVEAEATPEEHFAHTRVSGPSIYLEQPACMDDYVDIIKRTLGDSDKDSELPSKNEALREKVMSLISGAGAGKLKEAETYLSS